MAGEISSLPLFSADSDFPALADELEFVNKSVTTGTGAGAGGRSVKATLLDMHGGTALWPIGRYMPPDPWPWGGNAANWTDYAAGSRNGYTYLVPFSKGGVVVDRIGAWVVTGGGTGAVLRFGIWAWDGNTTATLILDAGTAAATTSGAVCEVTVNQRLPRFCLLSVTCQGAPATGPTIEGIPQSGGFVSAAWLGLPTADCIAHGQTSVSITGHTGSLPSSQTLVSGGAVNLSGGNVPAVVVRRSA